MERKIHNAKEKARVARAYRIRKKVEGTTERPRLSIFRSAKHIYAQLVDDIHGKTLVTTSTMNKEVKEAIKGLKKAQAAEKVGAKVAELAKAAGFTKVVFDRKGYPYHGRVAALAKGARDAGLDF